MSEKHICGNCGTDRVTDLTHGQGPDRRLICLECDSQFWKKWYTRKDWEVYVNGPFKPGQRFNFNEEAL